MNAIQHLIQAEDMVNGLDILENPENFKQELENSNKKNSVLVIFLLRAKNYYIDNNLLHNTIVKIHSKIWDQQCGHSSPTKHIREFPSLI